MLTLQLHMYTCGCVACIPAATQIMRTIHGINPWVLLGRLISRCFDALR